MSHSVAGLVLLAARLHTGWNALVETGGDRPLMLARVNLVVTAGVITMPVSGAGIA